MDRKQVYELIAKMEEVSWWSFLADIQSEIITETDNVISTENLNRIMSRVISRRAVL